MKMVSGTLLCASLILLGGCNESVATTTAPQESARQTHVINLNNIQLQEKLGQGVKLIDIRLPQEWARTGVVEGSDTLTFFTPRGRMSDGVLAALAKRVSKDEPVMLICHSGGRTRAAAEILLSQGYKTVYHAQNGIVGWLAEGRKTVTP